ncbi:MAG: SDR family oxidoreductase [Roseofilum sp. SBFL]|uniref:SDR family oxidoreductase n=1 Tax=unclassified Roseofilum TaxID=2620099 RepID=UPI001B21AFCC|nr:MULTISPECIES: SDR family oxidoreductase [unclassified Roseofilum]MBP0013561.1 SDR family oxidoreductase [Roseofilum sp. SID3]MBP0022911.1 SDR family oxidoreductase [Roseofilum sp. SID2]MBP0036211.1 SDR family oxidoreductase [Roseofilum sp. SID1]MBP0044671.1 SDR family oxidoreductase [Roseofilum sp. SBFL]
MTQPLENKIALVTGGSSGIGRATALAFAGKGAKVVIGSPQVKEGEETVELIKEAGSEGLFVKTDVTQAAEVESLVTQTVAMYGGLDYAFNNAGTEGVVRLAIEQGEEDWDLIINTNLKGVWLSMKYEIPQMLKQGTGAIVNNSSALGLRGASNLAIYSASKHGIIGLTKSLALEHARDGIRINVVCPGAIETDMVNRIVPNLEDKAAMIEQLYPLGRIGLPEEIANTVVWLCSDEASFITGQSIVVDGGFTT